jgi:hypothetical protein
MGALFGHADARLRRRLITPPSGTSPSPVAQAAQTSTSGMFRHDHSALMSTSLKTLHERCRPDRYRCAAEWRTTHGNPPAMPAYRTVASALTARSRRADLSSSPDETARLGPVRRCPPSGADVLIVHTS